MPIPDNLARGIAYNYWKQNPDGIYLFNWAPHWAPYQISLLKEIGDPEILENKNKMFAADRAHPAQLLAKCSPHNWMFAPLPCTLTSLPSSSFWVNIPVQVFDDIAGKRDKVKCVELHVEIENLGEGDSVEYRLNGHEVNPMLPLDEDGWVKIKLKPGWFIVGRNEISFRLTERVVETESSIAIKSVEIHLEYKIDK